jgi:hypothetical protein
VAAGTAAELPLRMAGFELAGMRSKTAACAAPHLLNYRLIEKLVDDYRFSD